MPWRLNGDSGPMTPPTPQTAKNGVAADPARPADGLQYARLQRHKKAGFGPLSCAGICRTSGRRWTAQWSVTRVSRDSTQSDRAAKTCYQPVAFATGRSRENKGLQV